MTSVRPESPADEYFKAVHQLKQFLSESDSSDSQLVRSSSKKVCDTQYVTTNNVFLNYYFFKNSLTEN